MYAHALRSTTFPSLGSPRLGQPTHPWQPCSPWVPLCLFLHLQECPEGELWMPFIPPNHRSAWPAGCALHLPWPLKPHCYLRLPRPPMTVQLVPCFTLPNTHSLCSRQEDRQDARVENIALLLNAPAPGLVSTSELWPHPWPVLSVPSGLRATCSPHSWDSGWTLLLTLQLGAPTS